MPRPLSREAHTVLDAGGDTSAALAASLYRCMDAMARGQILHVICGTPDSLADVVEWCSLEGHEILTIQGSPNETLYWIRKGGHR
ncbi:MAG: sulfurtransferase TusA family protein [Chloroflexi bacterium]|nr:sulfurtransferase TusA family protein [Chloroflexota bacterium]